MGVSAEPRVAYSRERWRPSLGPGLLVPLSLGVALGLPVLLLLINSFNTARPAREATYGFDNWLRAASDPGTLEALRNSLALGLARTLISLPIALAVVWLITRTDMPGRGAVEALAWLAIFVPQLPLTFGWILLLDPQIGLVNEALRNLPFVNGPVFDLYSFLGITWVHLASGAIFYKVVLIAPAFRRMNPALEEAGRTSGAGRLDVLRRVTLPLLAPAILVVMILAFIRSMESFEVELLLGRPVGLFVYSTAIYTALREDPPRFGDATALGSLFLVLLLALALAYQRYLRGRIFTTVTGRGYLSQITPLGRWRVPAAVACFGLFAVTLVVPLAFLVAGSFMRRFGFFGLSDAFTTRHWQALFADPIFGSSLVNSLIIAAAAAVIAVLAYSLVAYAVVRRLRGVSRSAADLLAWLPWAVPGILLGLGFLWLFLSTPLRSVLYGTLAGIIVALVVRESPLSTQLFKASFLQIGAELEEAARMSGASWWATYRRVYLPLLAPTVITVGVLVFVGAIRDISVPVLLYSPASRPLSILMLEYSFTGERERSTAIGVLITAIVMVVLLAVRWVGYRAGQERT